jgi:TetR/AcrR family transcriptional repressor of nem operon
VRRSSTPSATASRILDVAERLVQTHGFNGFSYADVSAALSIAKASLHYHFHTKAQLGLSLIRRYHDNFLEALGAIDAARLDPRRKLRRYAQIYADVLRRDRLCLCGMLAADYATLPRAMKDSVIAFFDANESWLARVLEEGRNARALHFEGPAGDEARLLLASMEGAMLVARSYGDVARFESTVERLLAGLSQTPRS